MTIYNKSSVPLEVAGKVIELEEARYFSEKLFDSRAINSLSGYIIIKTVNSERTIRSYGSLVAEEGDFENFDGSKDIYVYDAN